MTTGQIEDWNNRPLRVRYSRGKGHVPYVEDWTRNVIGLDPDNAPPWLTRQAMAYVARPSWFGPEDAVRLSQQLGRISKFQSLRSEDALSWSWFGTLALADEGTRQAAVQWLYDRLELPLRASAAVNIRQWDRVPHPNASRNGPEIDAIIDDPDNALIYVEAKWLADLGTGRGATHKVPDDQIVLRRDSLRRDPALQNDKRSHVVLGVSLEQRDCTPYVESSDSMPGVTIAWSTWRDLAECPAHPYTAEFARHLAWKEAWI